MKKVYIERNKLFKSFPMILLNNINEIDENFIEDNMEVFYGKCENCEGTGQKDGKDCTECDSDGQYQLEPYQTFLVDVDKWEIERLKSYGVELGYSNKLEKYILPIYDFGTSWSAFSYSKEVPDDYEPSFDETLERKTVY